MPTGYTAEILNGKITNASEFARECAHAFLIHCRDDTPGSLSFPSRETYCQEQLEKTAKSLEHWDSLDEEERYAEWSQYADGLSMTAEISKKAAEENTIRLQKILHEVESIVVPETHSNFKKFMIEQIKTTIEYDGTYREEYYKVKPYGSWVDSRRAALIKEMEYYVKEMARQEERYLSTKEWVNTLARIYGLKVEDND